MRGCCKGIGWVLAVVMCLTAAVQARAEEPGPLNYVVLRGGVAIPQDMTMTVSGGSGADASFKNGYNISTAYGRRFLPWLRAEVEAGYMEMKTDTLVLHARATEIEDDGKDQHVYVLANAVFDWQNASAFTPFGGFGAGITQAKLENSYTRPGTTSPVSRSSTDTVFAGQAFAGLLWQATPQIDLELRGRYFYSADREHDNHAAGTQTTLSVDGTRALVFDLGVRFRF